jgi:maltose/maltodextrin transport system permease protein
VNTGLPIRHILTGLLALAGLYLAFVLYRTGNVLIAFAVLVVTCLGVFIYLNPSATTFRYLFPGFIGFGLFVLLPLVYTIYIGFTRYSSQNLLLFDRCVALFRNETYTLPNAVSYKYRLYAQDDGTYILYVEDEKNPARRFASDPFELIVSPKPKPPPEPVKLNALSAGDQVQGKPMTIVQINRARLLSPLRGRAFVMPDDTLVAMAGLTNFTARERLWAQNPDGSLTNKKDGTVIRPDYKQGFFVNDKVKGSASVFGRSAASKIIPGSSPTRASPPRL